MDQSLNLHKRLGAIPRGDGSTEFRVWAPKANQVRVCFESGGSQMMHPDDDGFHTLVAHDVAVGDLYRIQVDGEASRPDPASRYQPAGVHGPSEVVGDDYQWSDTDWRCPDPREWIVYELHIGTWTNEGTFLAAVDRLAELVELGVNAIEIMPLADAPGRWNWGYDGVNLFAPNRNYGPPIHVKQFVDAAHAKGIAVFLDVVYNHFGPEGNYLSDVGPYLSDRHATAWGPGPNFDNHEHGAGVRNFFLANALYWLDEFHFDGLRVDAIHCIRDESRPHFAEELGRAVNAWSESSGRAGYLIAETNIHDAEMTRPLEQGGLGFHAQWCDDFLHSVNAVLHPDDQLTDRHYVAGKDLKGTLTFGHVYSGTLYEPPSRPQISQRANTHPLVYSLQTHDSVGNHPLGQRFHQVAGHDVQRACAALLMLLPGVPMIFMGEEFASDRPFQFFVDFGDEHLRDAVIRGRRSEYPQHDWEAGVLPTEPQAFEGSKVGAIHDGDSSMRDWYRSLIGLRKQCLKIGLISDDNIHVECDEAAGCYSIAYRGNGKTLTIVTRLNRVSSPESDPISLTASGKLLLDSRPDSYEKELQPNHSKVFVTGLEELIVS